jgi:hypothetical protein
MLSPKTLSAIRDPELDLTSEDFLTGVPTNQENCFGIAMTASDSFWPAFSLFPCNLPEGMALPQP